MGSNSPMLLLPISGGSLRESTRAGAGYQNSDDISPYHISNPGTSVQSAMISIVECSIIPNAAVTYPCYAWVGLYRNDYSNRQFLGVVEFAITTPTAPAQVNNNGSTGNRLLGTGSGNTDGLYSVNRILTRTGPGTLAVGNIPVVQGWYIGMELLYPSNNGGTAVSTIQDVDGATVYSWGRNFNNAIGGYTNTHVSILIQ